MKSVSMLLGVMVLGFAAAQFLVPQSLDFMPPEVRYKAGVAALCAGLLLLILSSVRFLRAALSVGVWATACLVIAHSVEGERLLAVGQQFLNEHYGDETSKVTGYLDGLRGVSLDEGQASDSISELIHAIESGAVRASIEGDVEPESFSAQSVISAPGFRQRLIALERAGG